MLFKGVGIMEGKVVAEYKFGNTIIEINDAYIKSDKEDIDKILKKIAEIVVNAHMKKEV